MKLKKDQYYTLAGTNDILQGTIHNNALVLKDLKASYAWQMPKTSGAYFEGYRLKGQMLIPIMSCQGNGRNEKCTEHREAVSVSELLMCECEEATIDLEDWSAK